MNNLPFALANDDKAKMNKIYLSIKDKNLKAANVNYCFL